MKLLKKIVLFCLTAILLIACFACNEEEPNPGETASNPIAVQEEKQVTANVKGGAPIYYSFETTDTAMPYTISFTDDNMKILYNGAYYTADDTSVTLIASTKYVFSVLSKDGQDDSLKFKVTEKIANAVIASGDGTTATPYVVSSMGKITTELQLISGFDFTETKWYKFTIKDGGDYVIYSKSNKNVHFSINKTGAGAQYTDASTGRDGNSYVSSMNEEFATIGYPYLKAQLVRNATYYFSVSGERAESIEFVFKKI